MPGRFIKISSIFTSSKEMPPLDTVERKSPQKSTFILGVGAQKSGTSWLSEYFALHPQIAFSPIKELHVWDQYIPKENGYSAPKRAQARFDMLARKYLERNLRRFKPKEECTDQRVLNWVYNLDRRSALIDRLSMNDDIEAYFDHFKRLSKAEHCACGEITPEYALIPMEIMEKIGRLMESRFEKLKVVFLMRDPVERLWSNMKHDFRRNRGRLPSLSWKSRMQDLETINRSRYNTTCEVLDRSFGSENVKYLFFEDLFCEGTIRDLCNFLEIDYFNPGVEFFQLAVKSGIQDDMPAEFLLEARVELDDVYRYIRYRFGAFAPKGWRW